VALIQPGLDLRRSSDRFRTRTPEVDSAYSFSFAEHYDSANTSHGLLLASNEFVLQPEAGFELHPHREMEIVTWVLQGALAHRDSTGVAGVVRPGQVQRLSAGTGVLHAETNDAWRLEGGEPSTDPVHLVQMWVAPDEPGGEPGYEQREVGDALREGGLVCIASGMRRHDGGAVRIRNRAAALHAARLEQGQSTELPHARYLHLFVAYGEVVLEGAGLLGPGDAVRSAGTGGQRVTATAPAELLVWEMHAALGG